MLFLQAHEFKPKYRKIEDGLPASRVNLYLVKIDTLIPGKYPWSPQVDSMMYRIVCFVTGENSRLDVAYNGSVTIDIAIDGEGKTDQFTLDLNQGGKTFEFVPDGSAGTTITAYLENIGTAILYVPGTTGIGDKINRDSRQDVLKLNNYPNPFTHRTAYEYFVPEAAHIRLVIYNLQGEMVEILVDEEKPTGLYNVVWHPGENTAGVYFFRLSNGTSSINGRCIKMDK